MGTTPGPTSRPSRADEYLTQTLNTALVLVDVRVFDHLVSAGADVCSFAKSGLVQTLTRGVSRRPASVCFKRG